LSTFWNPRPPQTLFYEVIHSEDETW